MTWTEIAAIGFLAIMVVLVVRGIRGHIRSGDTFDAWDGTPGDVD